MRILIALLMVFFLSACGADRTNQKYLAATEGKSLQDWRNTHVWGPTWAGGILNAIPALHFFGLAIDTIYVMITIDDLVYGNGAIISRETGCQGLVQSDDFNLYFTWAGKDQALVNRAFTEAKRAYDAKEAVGDVSEAMLQRAISSSRGIPVAAKTQIARGVVTKKASEKVFYKIAGKLTVKAITKAFTGMVMFVGPVAAWGINLYLLNDIDKGSRKYFRNKANIMCGNSSS
jgi:hypothetical protein